MTQPKLKRNIIPIYGEDDIIVKEIAEKCGVGKTAAVHLMCEFIKESGVEFQQAKLVTSKKEGAE